MNQKIKVIIDKKYYLTRRVYSTLKIFQNEKHLDNYLRLMYKNELQCKIIGYRILNHE